MPVQLGSAYGKVIIDFVGAAIQQGQKVLGDFESKAKAMGQTLKGVGDQMTLSLSLPLAGLGIAAGKASMGFETSMQQIVGLVGESQAQVDAWKKDLTEMGPAIGRGPKELADALYFVTSAGQKGAAALDITAQSGRAAAAGLGETKVIADATTSAMNAYAKSGLTAGAAIGVLVATVREGKAEADQIAPALGRVIPIASQLGVEFNQVGAAMAAQTRVGFDAAEAATNLSGILTAFIKPSKQASETLAQFGLSGESVRKTLREQGLLATLTLLKETVGQDDEAIAKIFGNVRAFRGVLSLVGENADQTNTIFANMANSGVADLDKAFESASQTAQFKFNQAMAGVQGGLIQLGNAVLPALLPVLSQLADAFKRVADWFSALPASTQQTIVQILALVAALGPALSIGGRLLGVLGTFGGLLKGIVGFAMGAASAVGKFAVTLFEVLQYLQEAGALSSLAGHFASAGKAALVLGAELGVLIAGLVMIIKFIEQVGVAARASNDELQKMAHSGDLFQQAAASFEIITNGSARLRDAFVGHQADMRKQLDAGQITLQEYNAEVERSARVAGLWGDQWDINRGTTQRIDGAVKTLTEDQARLERGINAYNDVEDVRAKRLATSSQAADGLTDANRGLETATAGVSDATQQAIDDANAYAQAQQDAADAAQGAEASLDTLKMFIAGPVGSAYKDFSDKQVELKKHFAELQVEQAKLLAQNGQTVTSGRAATLTDNERAATTAKLSKVTEDLTQRTRKKNETDAEFGSRMADMQVQADKLSEKLGTAAGSVSAYADNSKRLGEISTELQGIDQALADNATAYDDHLKRVLFDMVAEQLAADGLSGTEVTALTKMAKAYGIVDQASVEMFLGVSEATGKLNETGDINAFVAAMEAALKRTKDAATDAANPIATAMEQVHNTYAHAAEGAATAATGVGVAAGAIATSTETAAGRAGTALGTMTTGMGLTATDVATHTTAISTAVDTMATGISNRVNTTLPGALNPLKEEFKSTQTSVLESVNAIIQRVVDLINQIARVDLSKLFTGGTTTSAPQPPGRRAAGGPVLPGLAYVAGESAFTRPEIFLPQQPGYILTRQDSMAALSEAVRAALPATAGRSGATIINNHSNYFQDTTTTKMFLEQQRLAELRTVREAM